MLRVLVVALVLLVAAMWALPGRELAAPPATATLLPERRPLPDFDLVDHAGNEFGPDRLRGRFSLVFFGFTNCPDVCPITLGVLANAYSKMVATDPAHAPQVVFVSVDPNRDDPERIATYLRSFDPAFIGVTGSDQALAPLVKALGVAVEKHEHGDQHYNVVHNSTIYVIAPDARWIAVSSEPHVADTIAEDYRKIRRRYERALVKPAA
jgi:protein SCO1